MVVLNPYYWGIFDEHHQSDYNQISYGPLDDYGRHESMKNLNDALTVTKTIYKDYISEEGRLLGIEICELLNVKNFPYSCAWQDPYPPCELHIGDFNKIEETFREMCIKYNIDVIWQNWDIAMTKIKEFADMVDYYLLCNKEEGEGKLCRVLYHCYGLNETFIVTDSAYPDDFRKRTK